MKKNSKKEIRSWRPGMTGKKIRNLKREMREKMKIGGPKSTMKD